MTINENLRDDRPALTIFLLMFLILIGICSSRFVLERSISTWFREFRFREPSADDINRFRFTDRSSGLIMVAYFLAAVWSEQAQALIALPLIVLGAYFFTNFVYRKFRG